MGNIRNIKIGTCVRGNEILTVLPEVINGSDYSVHRFPGLGDSKWEEIISILNQGGYCDDIAIEGFHDPIYCGDKELEGQVLALNYLKDCRKRANK